MTPARSLRQAATRLAIDHSGPRHEFMCHCLDDALIGERYDRQARVLREFYALLDDLGIDSSGSLADENGCGLIVHLEFDQFAVQRIRFLHLFAHYLET